MLKKNKKQFVYMDTRRSDSGFTFLSLLMTLTILCVTLPFAAYLLKSVDTSTYQEEIAVQHFFQFLRDDLLQATDYEFTKDKIIMTRPENEKVTIEQYDNQIRRRVRGGNEIYLRDVKHASFEEQPHGIRARITTEEGETYDKIIIYYP